MILALKALTSRLQDAWGAKAFSVILSFSQ